MAYGNLGYDSMDLNDASRQQAIAQQRAGYQRQMALEQQNYERQRQAFQEQMIAREQARREAESRAQIENQKFDLQQRHKKDKFAGLRQGFLIQNQNAPAMEQARQYGRSIDAYRDVSGQQIAGNVEMARIASGPLMKQAEAYGNIGMANANQYGRSIDAWRDVAGGMTNVLGNAFGQSAHKGGSPVAGGGSWKSSYGSGGLSPFRKSLLGG